MAPTLVTDYNKYTGPQTTASQRDWIIRVDDVTNWSSYGDCATYTASGTNWLTAPILPFPPGAYVDGRWRGAISTDWFDCKNWDNASERDNAYFTVERSRDGLDYEEVLQVPGAINSNQLLHYTDRDPRP